MCSDSPVAQFRGISSPGAQRSLVWGILEPSWTFAAGETINLEEPAATGAGLSKRELRPGSCVRKPNVASAHGKMVRLMLSIAIRTTFCNRSRQLGQVRGYS